MNFSDFYNLNDKLSFSLTHEAGVENFTCLVKKIKDMLMAVVVSNRDRSKLDLATGDELFVYYEDEGYEYVIRTKIAQKNQYPLLILNLVSPPESVVCTEAVGPPAAADYIEQVSDDNLIDEVVIPDEGPDLGELIGKGEVEQSADAEPAVRAELEIPEGEEEDDEGLNTEALQAEMASSFEEMDITGTDDIDIVSLTSEDGGELTEAGLDDIPDIDTSELEAQLDANIEAALAEDELEIEELTLEPESNEVDPLAASIEIEAVDEVAEEELIVVADKSKDDVPVFVHQIAERAAAVEGTVEATGKDTIEESDVAATDAGPLFETKEPQAAEHVGAPEFNDYFGFKFIVVENETAERLEGVIDKHSSAERATIDDTSDLDDMQFGADTSPVMVKTMKGMMSRLVRLENITRRFLGDDILQVKFVLDRVASDNSGQLFKAVCLKLDSSGIHAAMPDPILDGSTVLISVDRPWNPPLRFDAVAVLFESEEREDDISIGKFRFIAIHPDDLAAIEDYLTRGPEFLSRIRNALHNR